MNFSETTRQSLIIAQSLAKENLHQNVNSAHLLLSLLHNDIGLASELAAFGKDIHYLRDWAEVRIEMLPKSTNISGDITPDSGVKKVFEVADMIRLKIGQENVTPICLLGALTRPSVGFTQDQLKTLTISEEEILSMVLENQSIGISYNEEDEGDVTKADITPRIKNKALTKFCKDMTLEASTGKYDNIIGREGELRRMKEILGRRTKPNVIVVGEPGVGKTALIEGFALDIVNENVPDFIKGATLFELDLGTLIAGAAYKGEVEERLKKIISDLKSYDNAILFIDEIHMMLMPNNSFGGASNMLKPELARGDITVIGATTSEEYRKYIEKDEAFSRRFDVLQVDEPDSTTAFYMLKNIVPYYEKHHNISVEDDAITESIVLTKRYFRDRKLPDASIDLIDQTLAAVKMMNETTNTVIETSKNKIKELEENEKVSLSEYMWLQREIKNNLSPILLGKLSTELNYDGEQDVSILTKNINKILDEVQDLYNEEVKELKKSDIGAMVAQKTGIPLGKLQSDEKEKLLILEDILNKRVVGQKYALNIVSEAIRESRAGLLKQGQPIASFFFMGPTGTGKTELAKTMADFLFNDESALIRFDMSEFKEEHSVALLYGAPPGYVGYEQGGLLVNKIRQKPYSIVLFDEIEKAHPSVFDLFLQILDEGKLSDRLGKEGDFSNAIILFTSNIGSQYIVDEFDAGNIPESTKLMDTMSNYFRPEFLARLTEIVPFAPIQNEVVLMIFDIQLQKLVDILASKDIELTLDDDLKEKIALDDFDPKYGARPIKGKIRTFIRRPISKKIINGEIHPNCKVQMSLGEDGEAVFNISKNATVSLNELE